MKKIRLSKMISKAEKIALVTLISISFFAIYAFSWTIVPLPGQ